MSIGKLLICYFKNLYLVISLTYNKKTAYASPYRVRHKLFYLYCIIQDTLPYCIS